MTYGQSCAQRLHKPALSHRLKWKDCKRCDIGSYAINHVFWSGHLPADYVFIGEAPGETEDIMGRPFVGPAGRMLRNIISYVVDELGSFRFAITNTICCRPQDNRAPEPQEVANCMDRLREFLDLSQPVGLILLGQTAKVLAEPPISLQLSKLPSLVIRHPAWILRLDQSKRIEQVQLAVSRITNFIKEHGEKHGSPNLHG